MTIKINISKFLCLFLILVFFNALSFSQKANIINSDLLNLKKSEHIPINLQNIVFIEYLLKYYGNSFKYYQQLKNGQYQFKESKGKKGSEYYLEFLDKNKKIIDKILLNIKATKNGDLQLILDNKLLSNYLLPYSSSIQSSEPDNQNVNYVERDSILVDKLILNDPNIQQQDRKILNRAFTRANITDQNDDEFDLYRQCVAGRIVPFGDGDSSKIITLDNLYHSIIFFDKRVAYTPNHPVNSVYGRFGEGSGEFMNPTGLTVGREFEDHDYIVFPIYIADQYNVRIVKVNFYVNQNSPEVAFFQGESFTSINDTVTSPYDIAYFKNSDVLSSDKLWVTQARETRPFLTCFELNGSIVQRVIGYKDTATGQIYRFQPGMLSRVNVYNDYFAAVSFIDNSVNALVSCKLKSDGTAYIEPYGDNDYVIWAHDILIFPENYRINSISFQKTSQLSGGWPYVWVTSGYSPPFTSSVSAIHLLKMNSSAHTQYIASTRLPYNSVYAFSNLMNTMVTHDFFDIYTIEKWDNNYGIRKYYPFAHILTDTLFNYCSDGIPQMKFKATFTNDCWIKLTVQREEGDTWEPVKFKSVTNSLLYDSNYTAVKFQLGGWNQASEDLYVNIVSDLPIKDLALGGTLRLNMKIYPEYVNPLSTNSVYISRSYEVTILRSCLPKPGGCPFLYVKNETGEYEVDNNLLHRMEYSEPSTNIIDKYKLRINPSISGGKLDISLIENENDDSFIDQVKMYAVDYPNNKKMAITEDNEIVLYDSSAVTVSDSVMFNYITNITKNVNFRDPSSTLTTGHPGDSLYAHFSYILTPQSKKKIEINDLKKGINNDRSIDKQSKDYPGKRINGSRNNTTNPQNTIAFITDLRNLTNPTQGISKDTAGLLTATSIYLNTFSGSFARRELESVVVLPLFSNSDYVDSLNIKWQSDFRMKYLGIAYLEYFNNPSELDIAEGKYITQTSDSDITSTLTNIDQQYGEVNASAFLKLRFDASHLPELGANDKREFVIVVTGWYINGDNSSSSKKGIQQLPLTYRLSQNYPNPFNPTTKINYELPKNSQVNLVIYDILGREVKRLVNNEFKQAGRYVVEFNALNYASGVYFYRIEAGDFVQAKKMVLIK